MGRRGEEEGEKREKMYKGGGMINNIYRVNEEQ